MLEYNYYLKCTADNTAYTNGSDHVLAGGNWVQFYPGINRDAVIEYDISDNKYRKLFNGNLVFVNRTQTDYTYISQIQSTSAEIEIRVEQVCGGTTASDWWEGYFSIIDGAWDNDRGIFSVTPTPNDAYRALNELGDKQYNLYTLNGAESVDIQVTSASDIVQSSCYTGRVVDWELDYDPDGTYTPGVRSDKWNLYTWVATLLAAGQSYEGIEWNCSTGEKIHIWRKENITIDPDDSTWTYEGVEQYGNNTGVWSKAASTTQTVTRDFGNSRGLLLKDIIQYIVNAISGLTYKSTILENDPYPSNWTGSAIGTENYNTGTDPNPLNNMIMFQKSDVKTTTNRATKLLLSFNEIMKMLKDTFNVDWFVDVDGYLRIENMKYFDNRVVDVDLTTSFPEWINATNKYSYERQSMPNRERFEFMESNGLDFIGEDIIYNRIATGNRYKDNQLDRVVPITTDVEYMVSFEDEISNEGWALVTNDGTYIRSAVGTITGSSHINADLSWANLHENYWTWDRVIETGEMNGESKTFDSWQKNIKQVNVVYPDCCTTFDPNGLKTTNLGDGEVGEARYRLIDGTIDTVFFYLDVNTPDPPPVSTYYIKYSNEWDVLTGTIDKLIFYG